MNLNLIAQNKKCNIFTKKVVQFHVKLSKNGVFCRFGDSVDLTEASAELFRPKTAEASAEASVSVVHYLGPKLLSHMSHAWYSVFSIISTCLFSSTMFLGMGFVMRSALMKITTIF